MYTLSNGQLQVELLDPVADQVRFGVRYCTGGYIFQISDARHGPLLTGPTYPADFNWFDGQGIPDAFNLAPLREPTSASTTSLIIGVGLCDLEARQVQEFCAWDVEQGEAAVTHAHHAGVPEALGWSWSALSASPTARSAWPRVCLNIGKAALPLCWFPHPFFPQPATDELCRFNIPVGMPENPGYALAESGFIARKAWPERWGFYQALDHAAQTGLVVLQRHPALGLVAATCSYVPSFFPIWGNQNTFSWEPFLERMLARGQELTWWIDYDF